MKAPKIVRFYSNGNVGCFDDNDEQIPDLQKKGTIELWFEWLEKKGINPINIRRIETIVNNRSVLLDPFKTKEGDWNYKIVDSNTK